jgi:hypothetical protein
MDQNTKPSPRLAPLSPAELPELKSELNATQKRMASCPTAS